MLSSQFDMALVYACRVHRRQVRKGSGVPYVAHLLGVASIVLEQGGTEDEAIAALLHDAVEDQGGERRLADIRSRFGGKVARIVAGCSDSWVQPKPPWRERKERYLAHLPRASRSVRLVSAADKLHNLRAILADLRAKGAKVWDIFKGGKEGSLWYYRELIEAYRAADRGRPDPLVDEMARVMVLVEQEGKRRPGIRS